MSGYQHRLFDSIVVNYDGNVGIGTNIPSTPLDVNGAVKVENIQVTDTTTPSIVFSEPITG